jgi:hypothetical protein
MARSTRFIVLIASTTLCGIDLFPPLTGLHRPVSTTSRGFLFSERSGFSAVHSIDADGRRSMAWVEGRIDSLRLAVESLLVVSAATLAWSVAGIRGGDASNLSGVAS